MHVMQLFHIYDYDKLFTAIVVVLRHVLSYITQVRKQTFIITWWKFITLVGKNYSLSLLTESLHHPPPHWIKLHDGHSKGEEILAYKEEEKLGVLMEGMGKCCTESFTRMAVTSTRTVGQGGLVLAQ